MLIIDDSVAQLRQSRDDNVYYEQALDKYKHGIYMARYLQDPLREVCALDNNPTSPEESDLFQLQLHPYQSSVPTSYLRRVFTRELCSEVANAGVCIQDAMAYQDAYAELQFLPGLGFRKVRAMVDKLVTVGKGMKNREDMKAVLGLGDTVFKNCNGFIRIVLPVLPPRVCGASHDESGGDPRGGHVPRAGHASLADASVRRGVQDLRAPDARGGRVPRPGGCGKEK